MSERHSSSVHLVGSLERTCAAVEVAPSCPDHVVAFFTVLDGAGTRVPVRAYDYVAHAVSALAAGTPLTVRGHLAEEGTLHVVAVELETLQPAPDGPRTRPSALAAST